MGRTATSRTIQANEFAALKNWTVSGNEIRSQSISAGARAGGRVGTWVTELSF